VSGGKRDGHTCVCHDKLTKLPRRYVSSERPAGQKSVGSQNPPTFAQLAGGKNASLGELVSALRPKSIGVPDGFATATELKGSVNK